MKHVLLDPLLHLVLAAALVAGCAGPVLPTPDHPDLRPCPLCGRGMAWVGRYYYCEPCLYPSLGDR